MDYVWIILAGAFVTYLTRIGGYLILSRFDRIHYRVEAGLNAVPAAVLTTLFAPAAYNGDWREQLTLALCVIMSLKMSILQMFLSGAVLLVALRWFFPA